VKGGEVSEVQSHYICWLFWFWLNWDEDMKLIHQPTQCFYNTPQSAINTFISHINSSSTTTTAHYY